MKKSLCLISLGCAKNLVDSERLLASASALGLEIQDEIEDADLIVINTCAFLESAVSEAIGEILDASARRKEAAKLLVLGCLPARYKDELKMPEVDLFLPPAEYGRFESEVAALLGLDFNRREAAAAWPLNAENALKPRLQSGSPYRAWLKISEGCDNRCSYCLIPKIRGPLKSYPLSALVAEAEGLVKNGARELNLVAQDLTVYGRDLGGPGLVELLAALSSIEGLDWLRLLYAYPERLEKGLVKALREIPKVLPYLDLPFQHAASKVLKRMGRPVSPPLRKVRELREAWPGLALRSTLIVGFPGETDADFDELLNFVEEAGLDHLGVFKFSAEEGSAAALLKDQVPQGVKEKRRRKIMSAQRKISLARNRARLGETADVLAEDFDETGFVARGRAAFQAPEVDGLIYFEGEPPRLGEIVRARLKKASAYDLIAELI